MENQLNALNFTGVALSSTPKILLLEDDETFQSIIKEFLESHSYQVVGVRNGVGDMREMAEGDTRFSREFGMGV